MSRSIAAVVHRWRGTGGYQGRSFDDDDRCTAVCVHRDGAWRVAWEHRSTSAVE